MELNTPIIQCMGLKKTYFSGPINVEVLKNVNLSIDAGKTVAIVGASGSGKSTLLHILGGLDLPTAGNVSICGQQMSALSDTERGLLRNQALGFVYQFHHLLPEFTALENVAMPLMIRKMNVHAAAESANKILQKVGLGERIQHKPSELSGGERQRVAIARALVTLPKAILADEPTGNLDRTNAIQVQELLMQLNSEFQTSVIIVTHDLDLAARMNSVLRLEDGELYQE